MWKIVFDKLKEDNLNPYPVGKHTGLCEKPYCVVKEGVQMPNFRTNQLGQRTIDIILFVPIASYVSLDPYTKLIRASLKDIKHIRKTGLETPAIPDDDKQAYTSSIEYIVMKKLEG